MSCRIRTILRILGFVFLAAVVPSRMYSGDVRVGSASQITQAMTTAGPGDTLTMTNGMWSNQQIVFEGTGSPAAPIVLRAETAGQVEISGSSNLRISGTYLVVDGLWFKGGYSPSGAVIEFRNNQGIAASHCRLTNSAIVDYNPPSVTTDYKWISLYGDSNTVDYCYFAGKTHSGTTLVVWLSDQPNYHRIRHNYFGPRPPLGVNGGETIRVGTSDWSMYDSRTLVEYNYFYKCDGESEIISSKSCENVYRYNVFVHCAGALTLRHGNRCRVEGNYFFGGKVQDSGGIRIIGEDHTVINNYMADLAGSSYKVALSLMNGVPDSPLNRYFQVKRALVAFNTLVNCTYNVAIGLGKDSELSLPPLDCVIANNIVKGSTGPLISLVDTPIHLVYEGNIMYGASVGVADTGIHIADPQLALAADGLWRPSVGSPLIGAATGNYASVTEDIDGHMRGTVKDVGADQVSSDAPARWPVTSENAGPTWLKVPVAADPAAEDVIAEFALERPYPNPFNGGTRVTFVLACESDATLDVVDILGRTVDILLSGILLPGRYSRMWDPRSLPAGSYFIRLRHEGRIEVQKVLYVK